MKYNSSKNEFKKCFYKRYLYISGFFYQVSLQQCLEHALRGRLPVSQSASPDPARAVEMLREMETDIPLLSITSAVWQQTYKLAEKARNQGKTIPTTDIIIFACCKYHKAGLFYNDQHFDWLMQL